MTFQFVDSQDTDPATRKRIRSHVMQGKNAGRKIARHRISPPRTLAVDKEAQIVAEVLSLVELVVYPSNFCLNAGDVRAQWMRVCMEDEGFYHASLVMAERVLRFVSRGRQDSVVFLTHMSKALNIIHKRLSSSKAITDDTISIVCSLSIVECLSGDLARLYTHVSGLHRMVEMRGGPDGFRHNPALLFKIYEADIDYALLAGTPTVFYYDTMPFTGENERGPFLSIFDGAPETPRVLAQDFLSTARFLNRQCNKPALTPFEYQGLLITLHYRLLGIDPTPWPPSQAAAHAGMVSMLLHMRYQSTHQHFTPMLRLQNRRLELAIEGYASNDGLLLWLLLLRAISLSHQKRGAVFPQVKAVCEHLDLITWTDVKNLLENYPWIDAMQDNLAESIWKQAIR